MALGLLGTKLGMTRVFDDEGRIRNVTVVKAGPCPVVAVRNPEESGYHAIQIAYEQVEPDRLSKPMQGVYQVSGIDTYRHLAEFRCEGVDNVPEPGALLSAGDLFEAGERVVVRGKSKGRGFAGVMKRYNYSGGRASHGSNFHRAPGSIGTAATPSRVRKGTKLPGQHGNKFNTIKNLLVVDVIEDEGLVLIEGGLPGAYGSLLKIFKAN